MKIHHASLKIAGRNCDDNAIPYMKMMHRSRTFVRNSWTNTNMVLANQYSQLLQLNKELFDCNERKYNSIRTIESKEHPQDHQCKKYKLSHRTDIELVDKQVSSSKDEKKNNNAVSINVPATTYSLDFTYRNCGNPMTNNTHPE